MSELQSFNDPLLAEWLGAVERELSWTINASPVLLAKGLSDGSLRETWKRKESRLPKIDDTRHQMWAREFLAMADRKMAEAGDRRTTSESLMVERLGGDPREQDRGRVDCPTHVALDGSQPLSQEGVVEALKLAHG